MAKSTAETPDAAKGPTETGSEVVGGETEVSRVYDSMQAGPSSVEPKKGHVVYCGIATNRIITKAQWLGAGVKDQDDAGWTQRNGYAFPLDQLNKDAQEVLKEDGQFVFPDS